MEEKKMTREEKDEMIRERIRELDAEIESYRQTMEDAGLCLCGQSPDGHIVEAVELSGKRFFLGVQFHPEFKSRPNRPHPLFVGLIEGAMKG